MNTLENLINALCPDGVEYKKLSELGEFYGGLTGKSKEDFSNGNAKYVTYMNVFSNISINVDIIENVKISESENQKTIQIGDVLFTGSSESREESGMSSVLVNEIDEPLYLNSFCFGFRLYDQNLLLPSFSKYLFRCDELRKQIIMTASGVTRFNISKKKMESMTIPLPPLPIQQEIVNILDKFTVLEAELEVKLEAELEARKKQYEYYRDNLLSFGDEVEWKTLGDIGKVSMCKRVFKEQTNDIGDVPFYKIGTFGKEANAYISRELFYEYKSKYSYPKEGDILLSASGTIGRAVIFDGNDSYFQDSNIIWIANNEKLVLNKFLYYYYTIAKWSVSDGGTISRLYNDNIRKTQIPLPPLHEQQRIVEILDRFDALTNDITIGLPAEIEARRKQYEHYRNKLLTFKQI